MTTNNEWFRPTSYFLYDDNNFSRIEKAVVGEDQICIFLNGQELATLMCSPYYLDELAIGFLRSEGMIRSLDDIDVLTISASNTCVDVWLKDINIKPPDHRIITSGCGERVTFDDLRMHKSVIESDIKIGASQVVILMNKLLPIADLYRDIGGVHTSALSDGQEILLVAEDMGLNNTIDRLWGKALQQGLRTKDSIMLCTGRIVSDVLGKAIEMGIPIIISLTSPTSLSIEMARKTNLTIIGYARGNSFRVYSAPERVVGLNAIK